MTVDTVPVTMLHDIVPVMVLYHTVPVMMLHNTVNDCSSHGLHDSIDTVRVIVWKQVNCMCSFVFLSLFCRVIAKLVFPLLDYQ